MEDGRYDYVLLNQVLEHLPEPGNALNELYRVFKPGGKIFATAPLFYEEHEQPYEFFRYTQFGQRYIFERAGFIVESIEGLEGPCGTAGYMCKSMCKYAPTRPKATGNEGALALLAVRLTVLIMKPFFLLLAGLFYRLDMAVKLPSVGLPKNYAVLARKP